MDKTKGLWLIQYGKERRPARECRNSPVLETPGPAFQRNQKAMSAYDSATQEGTDTELTNFDGRPEECDCWATGELACWPCFRDGFEEPNPNVEV